MNVDCCVEVESLRTRPRTDDVQRVLEAWRQIPSLHSEGPSTEICSPAMHHRYVREMMVVRSGNVHAGVSTRLVAARWLVDEHVRERS